MKLSDAKIIAEHKFNLLAPCCQLIHIAGGIRREKAEPHDIEIVCLPLFDLVEETESDLFGENLIASTSQVSGVFIKAVSELGKIIKGEPTGRMMQIELPEGIILDLFIPTEQDYYRQLAIRTGSADYSFKVIAAGWRKLGWVGTADGLRLEKECVGKEVAPNKTLWKCTVSNPILPPAWTSEQEFFNWLHVPFIEPKLRH